MPKRKQQQDPEPSVYWLFVDPETGDELTFETRPTDRPTLMVERLSDITEEVYTYNARDENGELIFVKPRGEKWMISDGTGETSTGWRRGRRDYWEKISGPPRRKRKGAKGTGH
jgi:hypothetical protein